MKFSLATLLASALVASTAGELVQRSLVGAACKVKFNPGSKPGDGKYDEIDNTCSTDDVACNYEIDDDGTPGKECNGKCELVKFMGHNKPETPAGAIGTHRVTICHRTCSPANPWVRITIDDSAWQDGLESGHGSHHDVYDDCNRSDLTPWGGKNTDYLIYDHGTHDEVRAREGFLAGSVEEKEYWRYWEPACPAIQNGKCCVGAECCGVFPGGGIGDPHFMRWGQPKESFHGECDLVMIQSQDFNGQRFDLHARTTIDEFYSYIEAGALRVGDLTLEMEKESFYLNGEKMPYDNLPMTVGDMKIYSTYNSSHKQVYVADLDGLKVQFSFYKHMLSLTTEGHKGLHGAVGILGQYPTGKMISRDGLEMKNFEELAFEWQVQPLVDGSIFHNGRSPQLPFEVCRMPTVARPNRRMLRSNRGLYEQAMVACSSKKQDGNDFELCIEDVMATGDVGMADAW